MTRGKGRATLAAGFPSPVTRHSSTVTKPGPSHKEARPLHSRRPAPRQLPTGKTLSVSVALPFRPFLPRGRSAPALLFLSSSKRRRKAGKPAATHFRHSFRIFLHLFFYHSASTAVKHQNRTFFASIRSGFAPPYPANGFLTPGAFFLVFQKPLDPTRRISITHDLANTR